MEDWLLTIDNKALRKRVSENLLVSGGCITSMLLDEKVNDYDIYIQDMDVLHDLVKYYVKPYKDAITIWDGRKKDELTKKNSESIFDLDEGEELLSGEDGRSVAFRTLKDDQIKIFVNSGRGGYDVKEMKDLNDTINTSLDIFENKETKSEPDVETKYFPLYFSPNAITLSDGIQIIIRFWGDHTQIHNNFDFIHATNYFTMTDNLVTNTRALESILAKQLYYQGSLFPITSIIRMRKFMKREWNINAGDILKILFQVSQLDLTNLDVLEEQLIGVDVVYFKNLIDDLRDFHKGKKINSEDINKIIDIVFNSVMDEDQEKY